MMDCLHPMAPNDEELMGFALDGSPLSEPTRAHLEQCEICQKRLTNLKHMHSTLVTQLYRRLCPDGMQLSMYCEGLLRPDEMAPIALHLLECPLCTQEVEDTRRFMQAASLDEIVVPFSVRAAVRRVVAKLVRQQAQLVTRGAEDATGWPRQYRADSVDLSLHLSRASSGAYMVLGILTSIDNQESVDAFEGARAELYTTTNAEKNGEKEAQAICGAIVDDLGNIVFASVPLGAYTLILHLPDQDVVIENLTIEHG